MFAFEGLEFDLVLGAFFVGQAVLISAPLVGQSLVGCDAGVGQQFFQVSKRGVCASSESESDDLAAQGLLYPPKPDLILFLAYKRPHFFGFQD